MGVGQIGLGMLAQVLTQRLDPLSLHPNDMDTRVPQPAGHWKPCHSGRLHDRLDRHALGHISGDRSNEATQIVRVEPEADRLAHGHAVIEDLRHLHGADRQVDPYGASKHAVLLDGRARCWAALPGI